MSLGDFCVGGGDCSAGGSGGNGDDCIYCSDSNCSDGNCSDDNCSMIIVVEIMVIIDRLISSHW